MDKNNYFPSTLHPDEVDVKRLDQVQGSFFSKPDSELLAGEVLALNKFVQSEKPLEMELGCGKGRFSLRMAELFPERNYIGIDRIGKWMKYSADSGEKKDLENLVYVRADVYDVLNQYVPNERVSALHVYFPDPWPKKRHLRRRYVNIDAMNLWYEKLQSEGVVYLATDHENYMAWMRQVALDSQLKWEMAESINERLNPNPEIQTNYEVKYQKQGKNLYYLRLRKTQ